MAQEVEVDLVKKKKSRSRKSKIRGRNVDAKNVEMWK